MTRLIGVFENNFFDLLNLIPEIYLLANIVFCLIYLSFYAGRSLHFAYFKVAFVFMQLSVFLCFLLHILNTYFWPASTLQVYLGGYLINDPFSFFFKIFISFLALLCSFISYSYYESQNVRTYEYTLLLAFSLMSSMLLISSYDLISFYLTMELISFCLYTLAASRFNSVYSVEAGIKYFVHGCCVSGIYVFGVALFFLMTGTTNYYNLHLHLNNFFVDLVEVTSFADVNILELIFLAVATSSTLILPFFKIALVPYHFWAADVYEGSPLPITAYFSIVIKVVMVASVIRLLYGLFLSFLPLLKYFLLFFGLTSVIIGALSALSEQKIKRILAFSSIGHSGYIVLGLVPMKYSSLGASINYVVIYAVTNVLIFAFLLATISLKVDSLNRYVVYVSDLGLLKNTNFSLSFCFSIALLSFSGLPPFAGFFAKFYVFYELWLAGHTLSVVLLILMSFVSTYYYLRFIKCLFFSPNLRSAYLVQNDVLNKVIIGLLAFFLVFYSLWAAQINLVSINLGASVVPLHLDEYYLQYLDFIAEDKVANFVHGFRT